MSERDPSSSSPQGNEPQYGPTYYAPVEMPLPRLPRPPFWMVALALVSIVATWLPLAIIARARVSTMAEPRIQLIQDMGIQPKFREQMTNSSFADDRAMRPHIPGTVARGSIDDDLMYTQGFTRDGNAVNFNTSIPDRAIQFRGGMKNLLDRGQKRFNIYCYVCHGYDGGGHGPVNERAMALQANEVPGMHWTPAAQLTADSVRAEPDGKLFNTVTNGIRSMPSYGAQISIEDRWAIVAYVRALQLSQAAPVAILTPEQRAALDKNPQPTTQQGK